ncbi:PREDICTED: dimethyladenosine transferase 2, mitochondrial [Nanorana parkeri]|uniref:dimethyladenosine transferase 2, mitochondrial n=1 Tax=Nanorana parkeri TaxID=125878 RepID=UPI000854F24E|nr:PREDICTED: dimethyladenosine transferase 2, mitochondrial [Nanorana parkeri]
MSSVSGIRVGLCLLRYGPQSGVPIVSFCRRLHSVADPKSTHSGKLPPSSCAMSTVAPQKQTKTFRVELSELSEEMEIAKSVKYHRRFITDDNLVNKILYSLDSCDQRTTPVIIECNPGPGVLTRALLDAGFNVAALEKDEVFLPGLKKLEANTDGQLRVFYSDPFRLDPFFDTGVHPPPLYSTALMEELGISEVPWDAESPLKVFGILHHKNEKNIVWRYMYAVYERISIFRYGRTELNLLMSEKMYKCLLSKPGDYQHYLALQVLFNIAFDIQLLHKERVSTFAMPQKCKGPSAAKSEGSSGDHLCLVRLTPRRNLFNESLSPENAKVFIGFIRQCLGKRKSTLLEKLNIWQPGHGEQTLQRLDLPKDTTTGNMNPEEYKHLYEILMQSEDFNQSFLFDDLCHLRHLLPETEQGDLAGAQLLATSDVSELGQMLDRGAKHSPCSSDLIRRHISAVHSATDGTTGEFQCRGIKALAAMIKNLSRDFFTLEIEPGKTYNRAILGVMCVSMEAERKYRESPLVGVIKAW